MQLSQVQILASGKAVFAGVGEEGRPGAVQIWKFPLEKVGEVQAHGKAIERMRISYDNNYLFTAGRDGTLIIHEIKDRDPRGGIIKRDRELGGMPGYSEEILTERQEMEDYAQKRENAEQELAGARDPAQSNVDEKMGANSQEDKIAKLQEELSSSQLTARNRYDQLNSDKQALEESLEKQIKALADEHHEILEARRNDYSQQMLEDAARYQELEGQKQRDEQEFHNAQQKIFEEHTNKINTEQKNHNDMIEIQKN